MDTSSRALRFVRKELRDKSYPLIHIDPNYMALAPVGQGNTYEKPYADKPDLLKNGQYETLGPTVAYGAFRYGEDKGRLQRYAALSVTVPPRQQGEPSNVTWLIYDTLNHQPGLACHPIALYKGSDKPEFNSDGVYFGQYRFMSTDAQDARNITVALPGIFSPNGLYWRHFTFSDRGTAKALRRSQTTHNIPQVTIAKPGHTFDVATITFSIAVNFTAARTINTFSAAVTKIERDLPLDEVRLATHIRDSASRQCAILCQTENVDPYRLDAQTTGTRSLYNLSQQRDEHYYVYRHIYLVWCAVCLYHFRELNPQLNSERDVFYVRQHLLRSISASQIFTKATTGDFFLFMEKPPRMLARVLQEITRIEGATDQTVQMLTDILVNQLKIQPSPELFAPDGLQGDERDIDDEAGITAQFKFQSNHLGKIWTALKPQTPYPEDGRDSSAIAQEMADQIAQFPYYAGAYAAEIDRIAKAISTGEVSCVPDYTPNEAKKQDNCLHGDVGTSLSALPTVSEKHAHPVAEYFNEGMVAIEVHVLRQGHMVQSVPYLQRVEPPRGMENRFPWPIRPAVEIAFSSGRSSYIPAEIVWITYEKIQNHLHDLPSNEDGSVDPLTGRTFAYRLLKRASQLSYLPAIVIIETKGGNIMCTRSHHESVPPIALIEISEENVVKITSTVFRSALSFGVSGKEHENTVSGWIHANLSGFLPSLWDTTPASTQTQDPNFLFYVLDRTCLGMNPSKEAPPKIQAINVYRDLGTKQLFGIPKMKASRKQRGATA